MKNSYIVERDKSLEHAMFNYSPKTSMSMNIANAGKTATSVTGYDAVTSAAIANLNKQITNQNGMISGMKAQCETARKVYENANAELQRAQKNAKTANDHYRAVLSSKNTAERKLETMIEERNKLTSKKVRPVVPTPNVFKKSSGSNNNKTTQIIYGKVTNL